VDSLPPELFRVSGEAHAGHRGLLPYGGDVEAKFATLSVLSLHWDVECQEVNTLVVDKRMLPHVL
jgi:hypothetical protein